MTRTGMLAWSSLSLAGPPIAVVLGVILQHIVHADWLVELPRAVGHETFFLTTALMGAAGAALALYTLCRGQVALLRHKLAAWTALLLGGGYALLLLYLQLFTKELQPF